VWTTVNVYGILVNPPTFSSFEETLIYSSKLSVAVLRVRNSVLSLVLTLAILFMSFSPMMAAEPIDALQNRIKTTTDKSTLAGLYKELGDQYIAQDRITEAADAFSVALKTNPDRFSDAERIQMAVYLSWADRLSESEHELRAVLAREPKHFEARTHLARVLSWQGKLSEAIEEADKVLKEHPNNREASLVKADALQWRGNYTEAIPLYRQLAQNDDFDARIGLSRSLLATGNRTASVEIMNSLKPGNSRQERELSRLRESIDQETRPSIDARYNYFSDSDDNRLNRYSLSSNVSVGNQKLGLTFRHTDAEDKTRDNRAEDLQFRVYSNLTESLTVGAGLGFTQLRDGHTSSFPTGHLRVDTKLFRGTVGANVHREVLSDTAELIENRIRMTNAGFYISQPLTDRVTVYAGYNYKDFSDGNHANDLQLLSQYAIYFNPRIAIGHRFRFLDFHKQSGSGFFDPDDYISNRIFTSYWLEREKYYTYVEGFVGHQTFRRNRVASDDFVYGGSGSIGFKPISALAIEFNAEGGTFAAGSASGFDYFVIGPRLLFRF
jgi:tetratricopeptide (TPR) repeat protein